MSDIDYKQLVKEWLAEINQHNVDVFDTDLTSNFVEHETFPGIEILMWGAADHLSNCHSRNESVDLGEVVRMAQAEAVFLTSLGSGR